LLVSRKLRWGLEKQKITAMLEKDLIKVENKITTMLEKKTRTKDDTIKNNIYLDYRSGRDKRQGVLTQDTGRHRLKIHKEMGNRWTQSGMEQTITLTRKNRGRK